MSQSEARNRIISGLRGRGAHLSLAEAVADFPVELMNRAPDNVPYTCWHQLEHIRICQVDILRYVQDPGYESPSWPHGYWPSPGATADEEAWQRTIDSYNADLDEFIALINDTEDILAPVEHNNGRSVMGSALIVIDHTSYHLGEFILSRQSLGSWKSLLA